MPNMKKEARGVAGDLENFLYEYLVKKAPFQLPMNLKEILVKIAPYVIIIMLIFAIPLILAALGLSALLTPFAAFGGAGYGYWSAMALVTGILALISLLLELVAVPGLFKRTYKGWKFAFYAQIVSFVGALIGNGVSGLLGTIIGYIIGMYILFQVRDLYKN